MHAPQTRIPSKRPNFNSGQVTTGRRTFAEGGDGRGVFGVSACETKRLEFLAHRNRQGVKMSQKSVARSRRPNGL
jgi:hypothetical protein